MGEYLQAHSKRLPETHGQTSSPTKTTRRATEPMSPNPTAGPGRAPARWDDHRDFDGLVEKVRERRQRGLTAADRRRH